MVVAAAAAVVLGVVGVGVGGGAAAGGVGGVEEEEEEVKHTYIHVSVCVSQHCSVNVWVLSKTITCHRFHRKHMAIHGAFCDSNV